MNKKAFSSVKIASTQYASNLFVAPMAGYTDRAFNEICYDMGAALAFTEMVSAEAVCRAYEKSVAMAFPAKNAHSHAIQLFGPEPSRIAEAATKLSFLKPNLFDINCGCPVPKVVKTGAGCALMKNPETVEQIVKQTKEALKAQGNEQIGVSVKFRSGWDANSINFMQFAEAAWKGGADLVTLHPRTRSQGYSGQSNWSYLTELKKESPVPVCASGDLFTQAAVVRVFEETGVDCAMIARGAIGQPWIYQAKNQPYYFLNESNNENAYSSEKSITIINIAQKHILLACELYGETAGIREMRKHLTVYTKGLPNGKALRNQIVQLSTLNDLNDCFASYIQTLE